MAGVLVLACFLAMAAKTLGRPQYNNLLAEPLAADHRRVSTGQWSVRGRGLPDQLAHDIEEIAANKRQYQADFASLASKMAAQTQLFSPANRIPKGNSVMFQPTNVQHRSATQYQPENPLFRPAGAAILSPSNSHPNFQTKEPSVAQVHDSYNGKFYRQSRKEESHPVTPVVHSSGFLADTPEVQAAREEHFKAVEKARAIAERAKARRGVQHGTGRLPQSLSLEKKHLHMISYNRAFYNYDLSK